jgi:AcrR family transcriptional regulator
MRAGKRLLTRDDWTQAALEALAEGGVGAVAVDRLARRLGTTRGSFYWHFADRRALIEAALERWKEEETRRLIPPMRAIADPVERLRATFREAYEGEPQALDVALAAAAEDPLVTPVVAQVTRLRLEFLKEIFTDLGLEDAEAADRAWLAYGFYIGHHQLRRSTGGDVDAPERLDRIVALLTTRAPRHDSRRRSPRAPLPSAPARDDFRPRGRSKEP